MENRVIAIIPAYNEEANIVSTIEDLKRNAPGIDYVIINDGSKDRTAEICEEKGYNYISLPVNLGLAGGFQAGMRYALNHGYDYAIQFDADGQHSAAYIHEMVRAAQENNWEVVIGSRFASAKKPFSPRMAGSTLITAMILLTTHTRIKDPTSGMRLFNKKMIPLFANELDFSPEPDTISLLMKRGVRVGEVQVEMRERTAGESYLNFTKSVMYMLRVSISILFVQWFRGRK